MTDAASKWKKLGEMLCDIGKYFLTVIPFTYVMSDKAGVIYVLLATAITGLLFITFGIYFISFASKIVSGTSRKRKIRVLKNSVFVVEEER